MVDLIRYAVDKKMGEDGRMTTSFQMFLLAAQELNFSRAAERAYVTPQCLSDHIKRIEERYRVTLFIRKPRLQLTVEGETMLRYITRLRALEGDMENELADISGGTRGTLRVGLPMTRGSILIPQVVTQFRRQFPNVEVEIRLTDTKNLEDLLLGGEIDLFLGVDTAQHALFRREPLCQEPLYLVIAHDAMTAQFGHEYERVRADFLQRGADMRLLQGVPFVQGHSRSTTTTAFEQLLLQQNIVCSFPIRVSNFDLHLTLCRMDRCASVCSRSHLRKVIQQPDGKLEIYAIRGAQKRLEIALISHRDAQPLAYRSAFLQMLAQQVQKEDDDICAWLTRNGISTP